MNTEKGHKAIGRTQWIIMSGAVITFILLLKSSVIPSTPKNIVMVIVCSIVVIPTTLYHFTHSTYLSEKGITYYRLGKMVRQLQWDQVEQACIIRDFRFSAKGSATTRIVFIPNGCEHYNGEKWSGLQYIFIFRNHVIWVDDTKQNREFIEKCYNDLQYK